MLPEVYELECPAGTIPIHIQASQRKTIGIQIRADQRVEIRVPYRTAYHEVISVIQEKADWIVSHYERAVCEAQERKSAPCPYQDRTWLPCGDEKVFLRIRYEEGRTRAQLQSVREKDGRITLAVTAGPGDGAGIRSLISQWYRHAGARKIAARAHAYAGQMGVSFRKITVKEQKTCWGSCSGKQNLNFNWKLLLMPMPILDYVVVHELAHLKQMNHSEQFWKEVEAVLPDYQERRRFLREHEKEYAVY